jgi:nitroreductase
MNVTEAIIARRSTRAFLPRKVEREKLEAVLKIAARAPSWANSQPWEVFVASGDTLERIRKGFGEKYAEGAPAAPEVARPKEWPESAKKRLQQLHPDMVRDCGAAADQFGHLNQTMFGAPAVIYICMDKMLTEWSLYDIGAYAQSVMLAAAEQGLSTIPAITLMLYPDVLRRELRIPDNLKLTIGIAVGYADNANKINNFASARDPISETVRFLD